MIISDCRSFSIAARKLYISPSKLSKQISWLEQELETKLLHRSTRQLSLTDSGNRLYEKASYLLSELTEIKNDVNSEIEEPSGCIRLYITITSISSYVLSLVIKFLQLYPKLSFKIYVCTDLITSLTEENFDIAITPVKFDELKYSSEKFVESKTGIFGSPKYLKKNGTPRTLDELLLHNCVSSTNPTIVQNRWQAGKRSIYLSGNLEINDFQLSKQATLAGFCLFSVPYFTIKKELKNKQLVPILTQLESPVVTVYITHPKQVDNSRKIKLFTDFLLKNAITDVMRHGQTKSKARNSRR